MKDVAMVISHPHYTRQFLYVEGTLYAKGRTLSQEEVESLYTDFKSGAKFSLFSAGDGLNEDIDFYFYDSNMPHNVLVDPSTGKFNENTGRGWEVTNDIVDFNITRLHNATSDTAMSEGEIVNVVIDDLNLFQEAVFLILSEEGYDWDTAGFVVCYEYVCDEHYIDWEVSLECVWSLVGFLELDTLHIKKTPQELLASRNAKSAHFKNDM